MKRPILIVGAVWLLAIVTIVICFLAGVHDLAHAYLVAWLTLISLPLGALPVLMILALWPSFDTDMATGLRVLLASLPLLALLAVPILVDPGAFYGWVPGSPLYAGTPPYQGFATTWFTPLFFALRGAACLLIWCVLALVFIWPGPSSPVRRAIAPFGLMVHLLIGTVVAYDWFMSLDGAFVSSAYGLIVIFAQCAFATTIALFASVLRRESTRTGRGAVLAVLVLVALAAYAQLQQYLVVWSANLPKEIVWYQTRWRDAAGPIFTYGAGPLLALAFVVMMPSRFASRRVPVMAALLALAIVELLDLICLASPRATFAIPAILVDVILIVALAGLAALCAVFIGGRTAKVVRHG